MTRDKCVNGHSWQGNTRYEQGHRVCKACRQEQSRKLKEMVLKPAIPFSESDQDCVAKKAITPLGAAIVEVLPDRVAANRIKRRFRQGICPPSALFSASEVVEFYKNCSMKVVAEPPPSAQVRAARTEGEGEKS